MRFVIKIFIKTAAATFLLICLLSNTVNASGFYFPNDFQSDSVKSTLDKGSRIRFWSRNLERDPYIAVVDQVREDELTITMKEREEVFKLTFAELEKLEISQGPGRNNTLKFALYGSIVLGVVGFIIVDQGTFEASGDLNLKGLGLLSGVLIGGAVGAMVGLATSSDEEWEEVPLEILRVGWLSLERGNTLWALTLEF